MAGRPLGVVRDALLELAWPTRCVVCDEPGELLCARCREELPWISQRHACPNCGAPYGRLTCTECDLPRGDPWETRACVSALPLEGAGHALVTIHKDGGERRLAGVIAAAMACALDEAGGWPASDGTARVDLAELDAVCFVPATRKAYRRRGFDHMESISRELCGFLDLPLLDCLARPRARDQRALGRDERRQNAEGTYVVIGEVEGKRLLLADDVITTGSSIRAAARALLCAGATDVTACSLARAW